MGQIRVTKSIVLSLALTVLLFFMSGCDGKSGGGAPPVPTNSEASVEIAARGLASINSSVQMRAVAALPSRMTVDRYEWTFSDGQTASGPNITVAFPSPGLYKIILRALSGSTMVAETNGLISVVDIATSRNPGYESVPEVPGDVNLDGAFQLDDVLLAAQSAAGLFAPDLEGSQAGDINFSGILDLLDVSLLARARLQDEALPTALIDTSAFPAGTVSLVSSALDDPEDEITITVGGFNSPQVFRPLPGYASFIVPPSLVGNDAAVDVALLVGGVEVARLPLIVRSTPTKPADAKADVSAFVTEIEALIRQQETDAKTLIDQVGGTTPEFEAIVLGASRGAARDFHAAADGIKELLEASNGPELAQFLQAAFYANGLSDFRSSLASTSSFAALRTNRPSDFRAPAAVAPSSVCSTLVPAVCGLKETAAAASLGSKIFAGACSTAALVAVVGGAAIPVDGPALEATALAGFVKFCVPLITPIEVAGIVADFVKAIEPGFSLTSDKTALDVSEIATLTAGVSFNGLGLICDGAVGYGTQQLITKKLGERVVGILMTRSTTYKVLGEIFAKVGEDVFAALLSTIAGVVNTTLDVTGVANAYGDVVTKVCNELPTTGTLVADAREFSLAASNGGTLSFNADGTAGLSCPAPTNGTPAGTITVSGSKVLCGNTPKTASVDVSCGSGEVTITMGDNGSLNDDIYEVVVGGRTVLTSSTPVRSTSVTLRLPKGPTTVLMRGRAAPDGVGTYFISFSGAQVLPGSDATSGSDLTPGTTKTFLIEVQ